jgi:hypothetical protein
LSTFPHDREHLLIARVNAWPMWNGIKLSNMMILPVSTQIIQDLDVGRVRQLLKVLQPILVIMGTQARFPRLHVIGRSMSC